MTDKPSSRVTTWLAVTLFLVLVYPLSFGPAIWVIVNYPSLNPYVMIPYYPLHSALVQLPRPAQRPFERYLTWWVGTEVQIDDDHDTP